MISMPSSENVRQFHVQNIGTDNSFLFEEPKQLHLGEINDNNSSVPSLPKSTVQESADKFMSEIDQYADSNIPTLSSKANEATLKTTLLSPRMNSSRFKSKSNLRYPAANMISVNSTQDVR